MADGDAAAITWDQWRAARPDLDLASMTLFGGLKRAHAMLELLLEPWLLLPPPPLLPLFFSL